MNKVIAVLGVIVLLTLAMLFFCIGFFTGSTVTPGTISGAISEEIKKATGANGDDEKLSKEAIEKKLEGIGDVKSAKLSDKIMGILASAGYGVENLSEMIKTKARSFSKNNSRKKNQGNQITVDSLLREMAISHDAQDDCSTTKTLAKMNELKAKPITDQDLYGKKVVFIGYFKNKIALQIQKLLATKGYKTHVEMSKDAHDSFVFCGPFKKDETAAALLKWLKYHDFSEARIISITKEAVEETLYDAMNEGADELPQNTEPLLPTKKPVATTATVAATPTTPTPATTIGRAGNAAVTPVRTAVGVAGRPVAVNPALNRVGVVNSAVNQAVNPTFNRAVNPAAINRAVIPQNNAIVARPVVPQVPQNAGAVPAAAVPLAR